MISIDIFVYSDESGVFDKKHEYYYVFGGVVFLSPVDRDVWSRKYISAERNIRASENLSPSIEVKASNISNRSKYKLYSFLSPVEKFGVVVSQKKLDSHLFDDKKSKQRYLDWAFKMAIKTKFQSLIKRKMINPNDVQSISFLVDEHTTATNGIYELRESLEREFKHGTYNWNWMTFYEPLFPAVKSVNLQYCNSAKKTLIRSADIVANRLFYLARNNSGIVPTEENLTIYYHP